MTKQKYQKMIPISRRKQQSIDELRLVSKNDVYV